MALLILTPYNLDIRILESKKSPSEHGTYIKDSTTTHDSIKFYSEHKKAAIDDAKDDSDIDPDLEFGGEGKAQEIISKACNRAYSFNIKKNMFNSSRDSTETIQSNLIDNVKSLQKIHNILQNYEPRVLRDTIISESTLVFSKEKEKTTQVSRKSSVLDLCLRNSNMADQFLSDDNESQKQIRLMHSYNPSSPSDPETPALTVRSEYQIEPSSITLPNKKSIAANESKNLQFNRMQNDYQDIQKQMKV